MKRLLIVSSLLISTSIGTVQCTSGENDSQSAEYQCPMECEGDKTYTKEGTCPICNMDLASKE